MNDDKPSAAPRSEIAGASEARRGASNGAAPRRPTRPARNGVPNAARVVRLSLLAIGVLLAGVFAVAFYLNPYDADGKPRTMATHTQLGMPPCNFVVMTGKPCPACGMT